MDHQSMAENNNLIIHQTLHGYKEGHKLLSHSVDLTPQERNGLLLLSDHSGTGKDLSFSNYLTGYPVPGGRFYAFAMTWYATEMPRPGCVWTHTFLIDISILWTIEDVEPLIFLFKRPEVGEYRSFATSLAFRITEFERKKRPLSQAFYNLCCHLYSKDKGLALLAESPKQVERAILDVWSYQWPRMKRSFTFCTGALSPRSLDGAIFDLQVFPYNRERTLTKIERDKLDTIELDKSFCGADWLLTYQSEGPEKVLKFMTQYGSDVQPLKSNFLALLMSYKMFSSVTDIDPEMIFDFLNKDFPDPEEARLLKTSFVDLAIRKKDKSNFRVIEALFTNRALQAINWDFKTLIEYSWRSRQLNERQLITILTLLKNRDLTSELVLILKVVPLDVWIEAPQLYWSLMDQLLDFDQLASEKCIWVSSERTQELWWNKIKKKLGSYDLRTIVFNMLDAENGLFAEQLSEIAGEKVLKILFDWILNNQSYPIKEWQYLIKLNPASAFIQLSKLTQLNTQLLTLIPDILSPGISDWKNIEINDFARFFKEVSVFKNEEIKTSLYTFFLTSCFIGTVKDAPELASLIFQPLHDNLKADICHHNTWQRFKMEMGRDLYDLVEQDFFSKMFRSRIEIPEWDRCEFLRISLLSCFLKYRWDVNWFPRIVRDEIVFSRMVEFGTHAKPIKKMFKVLKDELETQGGKSSFYFKILKKNL